MHAFYLFIWQMSCTSCWKKEQPKIVLLHVLNIEVFIIYLFIFV